MRAALLLVAVAACGGAATTPTPPTPVAGSAAPARPWPGVAWDNAEVVVFNQVAYGPGIALEAWTPEAGWNPTVATRQPVERVVADEAARLIAETDGGVEVSQCAFPRHAIVFFAEDAPVASANVCFECGDIIASPEPRPARAYDAATAPQLEAWAAEDEARLATYERVWPRWQALFRDQLGLAIDWPAP